MLSLTDLGWNPQRCDALPWTGAARNPVDGAPSSVDDTRPDDPALGRVSRVDRGIASVLTPGGTVRGRIANRLLATQDTDQIPTVGDWVVLAGDEIDRVRPAQ